MYQDFSYQKAYIDREDKGMEYLNFFMFIIPTFFALLIHNYLRHGEMSSKRKWIFGIVYFFLLNAMTLGIAWMRGVKGITFEGMTLTYKLKYTILGMVLGFIMPFPICLLTEDQITLGGIKRYALRFIRDIQKYLGYAIRSAKADLRAEVANSYLDWLWWMIEPVCTMLIYTLIFGVVFKASEQYFPIFIFIGITMWNFFSRSISGSVNTVRMNKGVITKIYMPKYILLFSKMLVNGFKMLVSFGVVGIMMLCFKVIPSIYILYLFPILIILFLLTLGIGMIMMHYGVYVSDLSYITGIVLNMLMYITGTFYAVAKRIPQPFGELLEQYNPLAFLIAAMRNALLYGQAPSWELLLFWGFVSMVLIALGAFTIYSNENAYVKVI